MSIRFTPCVATVALTVAVTGAPIQADTLKVPADFETIQAAVDAAVADDVVLVSKGVYEENVVVTTSGITLQGKGAIIDGGSEEDTIRIAGTDVTVTGFTIVNGLNGIRADVLPLRPDGDPPPDGVVITKNRISGCEFSGILVIASDADISQNGVNSCGSDGIRLNDLDFNSESVISKNTIRLVNDDGICTSGTGSIVIERNRIEFAEGEGIDVDIQAAMVDGIAPVATTIRQNTINGAGNCGIEVDNNGFGDVTIDKNKIDTTEDDNIDCFGPNFTITGNRCNGALQHGMDLNVGDSTISKNTVQNSVENGMNIGPFLEPDGEFTASNNTVENNTLKNNGRDGLHVTGDDHTLTKNRSQGNAGDGIDLNDNGMTGAVLDGNTCTKNGHQGISNNGNATDMTNNKCKQNGNGLGPDIAGAGDEGGGSVDVFDSNVFGTGGAKTSSRVDHTDED